MLVAIETKAIGFSRIGIAELKWEILLSTGRRFLKMYDLTPVVARLLPNQEYPFDQMLTARESAQHFLYQCGANGHMISPALAFMQL
jgi:hypothetical protein